MSSLNGIREDPSQSWGSQSVPWTVYVDKIYASSDELVSMLRGTSVIPISGMLFSRTIGGQTNTPKSMFPANTSFVVGHTVAVDLDGSIAIYVQSLDSSTVVMRTVTTSYLGGGVSRLLGNVATHADLPTTVAAAEALGWATPTVDDYCNVAADETFGGTRVEWYATSVNVNGNITWGNPVPLNTGDYQQQTTSLDSGKILIGGVDSGTFGESVSIDTAVISGTGVPSSNAVLSLSNTKKNKLTYSTNEQATGDIWIDGKAIYQKTINWTSNNAVISTEIDTFISCFGWVYRSNSDIQKYPFPILIGDGSFALPVSYQASPNTWVITSSGVLGGTGTATFLYTKV